MKLILLHRGPISALYFKSPFPQLRSKLESYLSVMLHGYLAYTILQPKDFSTEFPAIFYTVNPRGNCNCKLCSAQFGVKMRSVWEAVQPGTFAYNTGCIFNAREGLIGSIRHESLTYQNWGWEQSFPVKVELIYFCRDTKGRVHPNLPLNWKAHWLLVHYC